MHSPSASAPAHLADPNALSSLGRAHDVGEEERAAVPWAVSRGEAPGHGPPRARVRAEILQGAPDHHVSNAHVVRSCARDSRDHGPRQRRLSPACFSPGCRRGRPPRAKSAAAPLRGRRGRLPRGAAPRRGVQPRGRVWTLPFSANLTLRQLGLVLFLAGVGTRSGHAFAITLRPGGDLTLLAAGALVTATAALGSLWLGRKWLKIPMARLVGMVSGIHTQPAALAFASQQTKNDYRTSAMRPSTRSRPSPRCPRWDTPRAAQVNGNEALPSRPRHLQPR